MAAPHVAGAFAVLRSRLSAVPLDRLEELLKLTGSLVTDTDNGVVKPRVAVEAARVAGNGLAYFASTEFWTSGGFYGDRGTFFADVTGGGTADAIAVNNDRIAVRPSQGSNFDTTETWAGPFFGDRGTFFADVTGGGTADAIAVNKDRVAVRPSRGRNFDDTEFLELSGIYGDRGTFFVDVSGGKC